MNYLRSCHYPLPLHELCNKLNLSDWTQEKLLRALHASQTALRRYVEAEAEIVVNDEFATSGCRFCEAQIDEWYKHDRSFPHEPNCPVHGQRAALLDQGDGDAG